LKIKVECFKIVPQHGNVRSLYRPRVTNYLESLFRCGMCILFTGQGLPTVKLVSMCDVRKMPKHVNMCFYLGTWVPKCSKVPHETHHIQCHVGATSTRHYCPWQRGRHKCVTTCGSFLKKTMCSKTCNLKNNAQMYFAPPNVAPAILTLVHIRGLEDTKWMCNPCLRVVVVSHLFAIPILVCKSRRQQDKGGMIDQWRRRLLERNLQKGKIAKQKKGVPVLGVREGRAHCPCTFIVFLFPNAQCNLTKKEPMQQNRLPW
jgi:hypothetical protein